MRFPRLVVFGSLAAANFGDIIVDFDQTVEEDVQNDYGVEIVPGHIYAEAKYLEPLDRRMDSQGSDAIDARSLFAIRDGFDALSRKRQSCNPGYGYCSSFDGCCPTNSRCCDARGGICLSSGQKCCPNGSCESNEGCCGDNNCYPLGGECCVGGTHCLPGNRCYLFDGELVCCTDSWCTAHVDEYGTTSFAESITTTTFYTTTAVTRYYYWTVTWYYYYYYWTYSIDIQASIVTSSLSTTSTVFSVQTTDADAASGYFNDLSETVDLPTPAAATTLESLAGSTRFSQGPTRTSSSRSSTSTADDSSSTTEADLSTQAEESPTVTTSSEPGGGASGGGNDSGARVLWSRLDGFTLGLLIFGVGTGVLAVLL